MHGYLYIVFVIDYVGSGLYDELITRLGGSYSVYICVCVCVCVCDLPEQRGVLGSILDVAPQKEVLIHT